MFEDILEESATFQLFKQRFLAKGLEEGREEAYQQALLAYVELKFPEQARDVQYLVEKITNPEMLQQVLLKLFVARDGHEVQDMVLRAVQESRS